MAAEQSCDGTGQPLASSKVAISDLVEDCDFLIKLINENISKLQPALDQSKVFI